MNECTKEIKENNNDRRKLKVDFFVKFGKYTFQVLTIRSKDDVETIKER